MAVEAKLIAAITHAAEIEYLDISTPTTHSQPLAPKPHRATNIVMIDASNQPAMNFF